MLPGAIALIAPVLGAAGRGSWLCPLLALPGLWLLERWGDHVGPPGRALALVKLLWGMVLLWAHGGLFVRRLMLGLGMERRGLVAAAVAAMALYLGRSAPVLRRCARPLLAAVVLTVGAVVLSALPSTDWRALVPQSEGGGILAGAALVLSLSGYAAFVPPLGGAREERGRAEWICAAFAALLAVMLGAFGAVLPLEMEEPFLYLLDGVGLPGAFRRGGAILVVLAAAGEVALLGMLVHACGGLWRTVWPAREGARRWTDRAPAAAAFLAVLLVPPEELGAVLPGAVLPAGDLFWGAVVPAVAILTKKFRRGP